MFCNYYVLKLLCLETITFRDATVCRSTISTTAINKCGILYCTSSCSMALWVDRGSWEVVLKVVKYLFKIQGVSKRCLKPQVADFLLIFDGKLTCFLHSRWIPHIFYEPLKATFFGEFIISISFHNSKYIVLYFNCHCFVSLTYFDQKWSASRASGNDYSHTGRRVKFGKTIWYKNSISW
jgi:hypothetical protein